MVYESDFYTSRRPYSSRPLVSSYTVTVRNVFPITILHRFRLSSSRKYLLNENAIDHKMFNVHKIQYAVLWLLVFNIVLRKKYKNKQKE